MDDGKANISKLCHKTDTLCKLRIYFVFYLVWQNQQPCSLLILYCTVLLPEQVLGVLINDIAGMKCGCDKCCAV